MKSATQYFEVKRACLAGMMCISAWAFAPQGVSAQATEGTPTDVAQKLKDMGYENIRWIDTDEERIYTIENDAYKLSGVGIGHAIDVIQQDGLPKDKKCRLIVTKLDIPQLSLTYSPALSDTLTASREAWSASYEVEDSWKKVKHEKKTNSSFGDIDILVYPQLYFKNYIITQIYQVLFELSPALEVKLWPGAKATAQIVLPVYNDGYGTTAGKVHPGYLTLEQNFRLPYRIQATATVGTFDYDTYGADFKIFYPFKDERFSVDGRLGLVKLGYWKGFSFQYNDESTQYWSVGGNFFWPMFNTQFKLHAEQYILKEKGVKFEMIRHFRYASVGFYAEKAEHAKSNGGFRIFINLPPYKQKRFACHQIPRISTSLGTGITYNAGNEKYYYKMPYSNASENISKDNQYNPYYIKSELRNY
jgi:hypothetical protein